PQGERGIEGPQGDPGADGTDAPRADLIAELAAPVVIAHRGGGALVYPEQGLRGMIAATESGFLPEMDIQFLSDGTPVLCHDSTVDRTMTGVTGAPGTLTLNEWKGARLKPVYEGGRDDRPLTFDDVLDYLGGRVVLAAEVKSAATSGEVDRVINAVKSRGLDRAVILQSFDYSTAQQIAAAGLEVVFLCGATSSQGFATIKSDGINYLGPSLSMSGADMGAAASAGLDVIPYATKNRSQVQSLPESVAGYFSDDPWENSGRMPTMSEPGWASGDGWPAAVNVSTQNDSRTFAQFPIQITGGNLFAPYYEDENGHSLYDLTHIALEHMTGGPIDSPLSMYAKFLFGRCAAGQSSNAGFTLYRNDANPKALFVDDAEPGQQGYTFAARRTGAMAGWQYVNGASASSIVSEPHNGVGDLVPANESRVVEVLLEVGDGGTIRWTNLTTGVIAQTDAGAVGGKLYPMLRVTALDITILDLAIYSSPVGIEPLSA
ncbi:MAG: glycerophosphodiester phosphodiesterase family protein, partial [Brevibacterium sp.]|nr:glycerophosphodiester phosphodiesterase family protein [Brevibacterium sp.]